MYSIGLAEASRCLVPFSTWPLTLVVVGPVGTAAGRAAGRSRTRTHLEAAPVGTAVAAAGSGRAAAAGSCTNRCRTCCCCFVRRRRLPSRPNCLSGPKHDLFWKKEREKVNFCRPFSEYYKNGRVGSSCHVADGGTKVTCRFSRVPESIARPHADGDLYDAHDVRHLCDRDPELWTQLEGLRRRLQLRHQLFDARVEGPGASSAHQLLVITALPTIALKTTNPRCPESSQDVFLLLLNALLGSAWPSSKCELGTEPGIHTVMYEYSAGDHVDFAGPRGAALVST